MNMKLYGICFKLRGGPNLLDHVQENKPVPVEMMGQIMDQVGSLTKEETDFAQLLLNDWKKAFGERVPLTMTVAPDKGYDITCSIPDELIESVSLITGKEPGELMKEYASDHMKNVLGIDADIISVDVDHEETVRGIPAPAQVQETAQTGFSMDDLDEAPVAPAFEDVSEFADMDMGMDIPVEGFGIQQAAPAALVQETAPAVAPVQEAAPAAEEIPVTEGTPSEEELMAALEEEQPVEEEPEFEDDGIPIEGPEEEEYYEEPDIPEDEEPEEEDDQAAEADNTMATAVAGIYKDMVKNIRDRQLDERLGLTIGQKQ